jgi:hypothetical protein
MNDKQRIPDTLSRNERETLGTMSAKRKYVCEIGNITLPQAA